MNATVANGRLDVEAREAIETAKAVASAKRTASIPTIAGSEAIATRSETKCSLLYLVDISSVNVGCCE